MPAVSAVPFIVSVSIMWALRCGCSQLVLHSLFTVSHWLRTGGLITVQPEGGRGERDIMCNWTSKGAARPNALMFIMGVCVCVQSWPCCVCCREPGVLMCDSQYSAVMPVEHIHLNHWCWHTLTHTLSPTPFCGLKNEQGHFLSTAPLWWWKACGSSDPGGQFDVTLESCFGSAH